MRSSSLRACAEFINKPASWQEIEGAVIHQPYAELRSGAPAHEKAGIGQRRAGTLIVETPAKIARAEIVQSIDCNYYVIPIPVAINPWLEPADVADMRGLSIRQPYAELRRAPPL